MMTRLPAARATSKVDAAASPRSDSNTAFEVRIPVTPADGHAKIRSHSSSYVDVPGSHHDHAKAAVTATAKRSIMAPALRPRTSVLEEVCACRTARAATKIEKHSIAHRTVDDARCGRLS